VEAKDMIVQPLWQTTAIALWLITTIATHATAADGNAVGGSVRSKKDNSFLEKVSVTLVQNNSRRDNTRGDDGIYLLLVPTRYSAFDLLFEKNGFVSIHLERLKNEQEHHKVAIVKLMPVEEIPNLSTPELEQLVNETVRIKRRANEGDLPAESQALLLKAAKDILTTLQKYSAPTDIFGNIPTTPERERLRERIEQELKTIR
jgi:hypothetical protein